MARRLFTCQTAGLRGALFGLSEVSVVFERLEEEKREGVYEGRVPRTWETVGWGSDKEGKQRLDPRPVGARTWSRVPLRVYQDLLSWDRLRNHLGGSGRDPPSGLLDQRTPHPHPYSRPTSRVDLGLDSVIVSGHTNTDPRVFRSVSNFNLSCGTPLRFKNLPVYSSVSNRLEPLFETPGFSHPFKPSVLSWSFRKFPDVSWGL